MPESNDHPKRKTPRLQSLDYRQPGAYFITICAHQKKCLFGKIVEGEMELADLGHVVAKAWADLPNHYPHVLLDEFMVMPNHFHGILFLRELNDTRNVTGQTDTTGRVPTHAFGQPNAGSLSTVIGSFKAQVTRKAHETLGWIGPIWQPRFYDHVIREDEDLYNTRKYVQENPQKWEHDRENPDPVGT